MSRSRCRPGGGFADGDEYGGDDDDDQNAGSTLLETADRRTVDEILLNGGTVEEAILAGKYCPTCKRSLVSGETDHRSAEVVCKICGSVLSTVKLINETEFIEVRARNGGLKWAAVGQQIDLDPKTKGEKRCAQQSENLCQVLGLANESKEAHDLVQKAYAETPVGKTRTNIVAAACLLIVARRKGIGLSLNKLCHAVDARPTEVLHAVQKILGPFEKLPISRPEDHIQILHHKLGSEGGHGHPFRLAGDPHFVETVAQVLDFCVFAWISEGKRPHVVAASAYCVSMRLHGEDPGRYVVKICEILGAEERAVLKAEDLIIRTLSKVEGSVLGANPLIAQQPLNRETLAIRGRIVLQHIRLSRAALCAREQQQQQQQQPAIAGESGTGQAHLLIAGPESFTRAERNRLRWRDALDAAKKILSLTSVAQREESIARASSRTLKALAALQNEVPEHYIQMGYTKTVVLRDGEAAEREVDDEEIESYLRTESEVAQYEQGLSDRKRRRMSFG